MKKQLCIVLLTLFLIGPLLSRAQVYSTRTGFIGFYSKTALEDIKAENNQAYAAIDLGKRQLALAVLLKGFTFVKELMQEHFNENYVESDKYPKATFSGSFTGDVNPAKDGEYKVTVSGNLSLHNMTKPISAPATIEVKNGHLIGSTEFRIKPEDFNISIPGVVRDKIDREITVKVNIDCAAK
jgi:polyisoprenoid-binding protein YceI